MYVHSQMYGVNKKFSLYMNFARIKRFNHK